MVAAIYVRTATRSPRAESAPLDRQERACRGHAALLGYVVEDRYVYRDGAAGHPAASRPGLAALCQAIRRGEVACIITESGDRLSRDADELAALVQTFTQDGGRVLYAEGGVSWLN
jgi:site-specific DNA recombinase